MRAIALLLTICGTILGWCQHAPIATLSAPNLLTKLQSKDWTQRDDAVEKIKSAPETLRSPQLRLALLNLLDRENKERQKGFDENLNSNDPDSTTANVDSDTDEEYGEYYASLGDLVDSFGNWNDPREACIMTNSGFIDYPSSRIQSAARAKAAMPCLLKMVQEDAAVALPMLVEALSKGDGIIDPESVANAKQILFNDLRSKNIGVRASAVNALRKFGGTDFIPILQEVSRSDPATEKRPDTGTSWFPIRESAADAITAIQKRAERK